MRSREWRMEIRHRLVSTNGIKMHIAEAGDGPLVVMCHGFPESWYSWRHQLTALAEAGFHAVAPDMRGYGRTDRPEALDQYTLFHLVGDMVGLLDALGAAQAVIAGHDWGAPVAWHAALMRPDRFRAVIGLSVPFLPRGPERPTTLMPQSSGPPLRAVAADADEHLIHLPHGSCSARCCRCWRYAPDPLSAPSPRMRMNTSSIYRTDPVPRGAAGAGATLRTPPPR